MTTSTEQLPEHAGSSKWLTLVCLKACRNSYGVGLSRHAPRDLMMLKKCSSVLV